MKRYFCIGCSVFLALACLATTGWSDSLKIKKDGTVVEGDIVGENDEALVIQVSFDQGTITSRRTYLKADITDITRTPPEEKRKQKMEYWYNKVMRYQLNPKTSYAVEYYDSVLKDVFEKYQQVFPESPHTKEIKDLEAQWKAERIKVVAGEVKRDNKWMTPAAAEQLTDDQKALAILDTARSLIKSKEYKLAWLQVAKAVKVTQNPDVMKQIVEVGRDAYSKYADSLVIKENWLKTQIDYQERRDARTNVSVANLEAQTTFAPGSKVSVSGDDERVLRSAEVQGDAVRANAARSDQIIVEFKNKLAQVQDEIAQLKQKKVDWDAGMEVGGIKKSDVGR